MQKERKKKKKNTVDKDESLSRKGARLVTRISTVHMHEILYTNQRRPFHIRIMIHALQEETENRGKKKKKKKMMSRSRARERERYSGLKRQKESDVRK